jgi:hypothetical protein
MRTSREWIGGMLVFSLLLQASAGTGQAQLGGTSSTALCGRPAQKVIRFSVPLLTQHYFIAGRRADGGAWSWGFNYPATWRVSANPPDINQVDFRYAGWELIVTPDPQGITHGYRLLPPIQRGSIAPQDAINWYTQRRFQNFRVRGRMDVPGLSVPGSQAVTVNLFYHAQYRGRPVEGLLVAEVVHWFEPMLGGLVTTLAFTELQIAADLPVPECYEKINSLIGIALTGRNVRELGDWKEAQGWINTLGGLMEVRDPRTGERFLVSFLYRYWWRDGSTLIGTNDPSPQPGTLLQLP